MQNFKIITFLLLGNFWLVDDDEDLVDNQVFLSHHWGFSWGLWLRLTKKIVVNCTKTTVMDDCNSMQLFHTWQIQEQCMCTPVVLVDFMLSLCFSHIVHDNYIFGHNVIYKFPATVFSTNYRRALSNLFWFDWSNRWLMEGGDNRELPCVDHVPSDHHSCLFWCTLTQLSILRLLPIQP